MTLGTNQKNKAIKLEVTNLEREGFQLKDELDHTQLIPFIQSYMGKKTKAALFYKLFNSLSIMIFSGLVTFQLLSGEANVLSMVSSIGFGLVLVVFILPIHEYIHKLAYQWVGAKNTSFDAHWKKMYFMALADQFVASRKEFRIVALAPFVLITLVLLSLLIFGPANWNFTLLTTLTLHSMMCGGDFGLLSYFEFHKNEDVITYDEVALRKSYFYTKPFVSVD